MQIWLGWDLVACSEEECHPLSYNQRQYKAPNERAHPTRENPNAL